MKIDGQIKQRPSRVNPEALIVAIPVAHADLTRTVDVYVSPQPGDGNVYVHAEVTERKPEGKAVVAPKKSDPKKQTVEVGKQELAKHFQDGQREATKATVDRLRKVVAAELKAIKGKEHAQTKDVAARIRAELTAISKGAK